MDFVSHSTPWSSVESLDNSRNANATITKDIRHFDPAKDCQNVPDFLWASIPCETYSKLAGGLHRNLKKGELESSPAAREHNFLFTKLASVMRWAQKLHPHVIFVIENPQGALSHMPLMNQLHNEFDLPDVTVDYCTLGRKEKKPTVLWTNCKGLHGYTQPRFKCAKSCPYGKGKHPSNVRDNKEIDHSIIPVQLAEAIAEYVHSKLFLDFRSYKPAANPGD